MDVDGDLESIWVGVLGFGVWRDGGCVLWVWGMMVVGVSGVEWSVGGKEDVTHHHKVALELKKIASPKTITSLP